jgi:hypothetical protein
VTDLTVRARKQGIAYQALVRERDLLAWASERYREQFSNLQDADTETINVLATHQSVVRERREAVSRVVAALDFAFKDFV